MPNRFPGSPEARHLEVCVSAGQLRAQERIIVFGWLLQASPVQRLHAPLVSPGRGTSAGQPNRRASAFGPPSDSGGRHRKVAPKWIIAVSLSLLPAIHFGNNISSEIKGTRYQEMIQDLWVVSIDSTKAEPRILICVNHPVSALNSAIH